MESGVFRLNTYGILDIGEVPSKERVMKLTPKALTNKAAANTR